METDHGKKEIDQIDKLLRQQARAGAPRPAQKCAGFDPDLATAYFEKALSTVEQQQYEKHIADCQPCRKLNTEFAMLFEQTQPLLLDQTALESEPVASLAEPTTTVKPKASFSQTVREWFFGSQLRWVMPVLLVGLIAGAVWFYSGKKADHNDPDKIVKNTDKTDQNPDIKPAPKPQPEQTAAPLPAPAPTTDPAAANDQNKPTPKPSTTATPVEPDLNDKVARDLKPEDGVKGSAPVPAKPAPANLPSNSHDDKSIGEVADDRKTNLPLVTGTDGPNPPAPPKDDQKKKSTDQPDNNSIADNKAERRAGSPLINRSLTEDEKPTTRKVGGKNFSLIKGVWTDQQYDAAKKLPVVNLVKQSAEYQQLLAELPDLKPFFELGARVIVVYQGKVYNLR